MRINSPESEERLARLEAMMNEYREAERRGFIKRAMALWKQAEAAHRATMYAEPQGSKTVH